MVVLPVKGAAGDVRSRHLCSDNRCFGVFFVFAFFFWVCFGGGVGGGWFGSAAAGGEASGPESRDEEGHWAVAVAATPEPDGI